MIACHQLLVYRNGWCWLKSEHFLNEHVPIYWSPGLCYTSEIAKSFHSLIKHPRAVKDGNYPASGRAKSLVFATACQNNCRFWGKILLLTNDNLENVFYTVFCFKKTAVILLKNKQNVTQIVLLILLVTQIFLSSVNAVDCQTPPLQWVKGSDQSVWHDKYYLHFF